MKSEIFKADINKLMKMIIHSFYKNKDIFLRELISNSSDAIDKAKYTNLSQNINDVNYEIKIRTDKDKNVLIIEDNGIGMDEQDLEENLSTIAHSGTQDFLEKHQLQSDMIGQFGVGFYSSFLVANYVEVITKKLGSQQALKWSSDAIEKYSIEETETSFPFGTRIVLHLKEEDVGFLENARLKEIIKQHSNFVTYPIKLYEQVNEKQELEEDSDNDNIEDIDTDNSGSKTTPEEIELKDLNSVTEVKEAQVEWTQINDSKPIWYMKPNQPLVEDYTNFFKTITSGWEEPLFYKHFEAEGQLEFRGILYIPKRAPHDMFQDESRKNNVKLYVKKVFITDDCREILPTWMNFVTGVIDSSDLPLNVSREMLQNNHVISQIKKHLTKLVIDTLSDLSEDKEKYQIFYNAYFRNLKLGVYEDEKNREKLFKLLKFHHNKSESQISIEEYIENMKENQKQILYLSGENLASVNNSVFLDKVKKNDYQVLYLVDSIDEFMIQRLSKFQEYELINISKSNFTLEAEINMEEYKPLLDFMNETLKGKVEKVVLSNSLTELPSCIVTEQYTWSSNMERIMKAQALGDNSMAQFMKSRKTLEINPSHAFIQKINATEDNKEKTKLTNILLDVSYLTSGFTIEDVRAFAKNIYDTI